MALHSFNSSLVNGFLVAFVVRSRPVPLYSRVALGSALLLPSSLKDRRVYALHLGTYLNGGAFDKINLIVNSIAE